MRIVLVARDFAPSEVFTKLAQELTSRGHNVLAFLGKGKPFEASIDAITRAVCDTDVVLLGISNDADEEVAAGEAALKNGIPFGLYSDMYGSYRLAAFERLRMHTRFLFVINSGDAEDAGMIFPKTDIVVSGNPMWEDFAFPRVPREEVRRKLGVADEETMILCPGDKSIVVNFMLFGLTVEAVHRPLLMERKPRVIIALHPGDPHPPEVYRDVVDSVRRVPIHMVTRDFMPTLDIVAGIDILVTAVSAVGIAAAFQRKPVINLFTEFLCVQLERDRGHRRWEPCELGVAEAVHGGSVDALAMKMDQLLNPDGFAPTLKRQEIIYPPPPTKGTGMRVMISLLENLF